MAAAVIPENEAERLAAIRRYDVLDTPPDGAFERITALAARLFDVPISIVSIVDTDRIWFKSHHGLEVDQIDREAGLCASAILQDVPWLVTDAKSDPRTLANPLVAGEFGLQFYAGAPLTTRDGYNLGTLCVIDQAPREISDQEVETLSDLASLVMDELELRRSARTAAELEAELRERAERVAANLQADLLPRELPEIAGLDIAARYHVANREQVGGDFYDVVADEDGCALVVGDACGKGTNAAALTGTARWTLRTIVTEPWTPAAALRRLNDVLVGAYDNPERYCTIALAAVRADASGGASMTVALGGHPHPLIVRGDGTVERVGEIAPIVGWSGDADYTEVAAHLAPGDLVVLFTDGLLEAVAGHGATDDAAVQTLLAPMAGCAASEVADRIDVVLPDGELQDDAAFLVVRAS